MFARLLRDPVLHFIVAGGALFLVTRFIAGPEQVQDSQVIRVDRESLLVWMQYQANAFDAQSFERALDNMAQAELEELIDDYVTEEVLYREAAALGLDRSDYIIRQRMVDKMRFLLTDLAGTETVPATAELQSWLEANRALYRIEPSASFTHVFIDAAGKSDEQALAQAQALQAELNSGKAAFDDAPRYGDRFPYLRNYVERTLGFIAGHFGESFAALLQELSPAAGLWQGPLRSEHGYHLVMLTALAPGREPALEEVSAQVTRDLVAARGEQRLAQMVADVRSQYRVDASSILARPQSAGTESQGAAQIGAPPSE